MPLQVEERQASELSLEEFVLRFMHPGRPVLIKVLTHRASGVPVQRFMREAAPCVHQGVTQGWRAAREWVTPAGEPDVPAILAAGAIAGTTAEPPGFPPHLTRPASPLPPLRPYT